MYPTIAAEDDLEDETDCSSYYYTGAENQLSMIEQDLRVDFDDNDVCILLVVLLLVLL